MTREHEFWRPEPLFEGRTVFCLASGPSLTEEVARRVRGRHCIVVNASVAMAPWADVWFFTDSWLFPRYGHHTQGMIVTLSRSAKHEAPARVRRIKAAWRPDFARGEVRQGRSSGHTAVALAIAMGASRVALIGYDMRVVADREHHHSDYVGPRDLAIYEREFVPGFAGWRAAAAAVGADIVNCTPGSAVTEFPFADLDEVLACDRS